MVNVVQIAIIGKIAGNANADEVIGNRATLKKMYSSDGGVYPFVSARAVKFAIRKALQERGYKIDPFVMSGDNMIDSGDPLKFVDNDLFGYMKAPRRERGQRGEIAERRQAPVALSYFKALRDTPIKSEFAARFPRPETGSENPQPFEVEVAEFIGRLCCLIYPYTGLRSPEEKKKWEMDPKEREKRVRDFAEILLTPCYVLPRRTNSLTIPEYYGAMIILSSSGPLPVYQYLDYSVESTRIIPDTGKLASMMSRGEMKRGVEAYLIDYLHVVEKPPDGIQISNVEDASRKISLFLTSEKSAS